MKSDAVKEVVNKLRNPRILDCYAFEKDKTYLIRLDRALYEKDVARTVESYLVAEFGKFGVNAIIMYADAGQIEVVPCNTKEEILNEK